ncbi:MAG: glutamate mutase L [Chloroflexota bacterium]|nr:glutamate mutase L [Chloroflexota bacterium]
MDTPEDQAIQSILAIDCGTRTTRALLLDIVAEEYRFIGSGSAPTTAEAPYSDLTVGVYNAILDLEATTGRALVEGGHVVTPQHRDGHGVDVFVATCSAMPAVRLVVAGITGEFSTRAARRAAAGTYTHLLGTISVDEPVAVAPSNGLTSKAPRAMGSRWAATQIDKLLALSPDVVLLTGGVEAGPITPLLRLAGVVVQAVQETRRREQEAALVGGTVAPPPLLFFAGNSDALERVQAALGDTATLVALPNIQPAIGQSAPGPTRDALLGLVRQRGLPALPGLDTLRNWTKREIEPTAHAIELVTRYISLQYKREVLTADVGAAHTTISVAGGTDSTHHATAVRGDFGLAQGLSNLLAAVGPDAVRRWLPFEASAEEINDWALNRVLRPWTVAQSTRDLALEQAFAREALRHTLHELRDGAGSAATGDLLIGTGGVLAHAPRVGQAAAILLDALEPTGEGVGSLEIALDSTLMLPALGALAPVHPAAAAYLFDRDCLLLLGTCVVPLGPPPEGTPIAVEVTVEYAEAGTITIEVPYGNIEVIPLRPEQRASLRVKPGPTFHIGSDEPGKPVQTKPGEEIKGGLIGLIIDARGRPLVLPSDPATRAARLLTWGQALRAYTAQEDFSLTPEPTAPPPGPVPAAPVEPAPLTGEPGSFQTRFGRTTGRFATGMLDTSPAPTSPPTPPLKGEGSMIQTPPLPSGEGVGGWGPAANLPSPVPDPGLLPPVRSVDSAPVVIAPPAAGPATLPPVRRTGNTGKLNLPSKGTAPLEFPKREDDP